MLHGSPSHTPQRPGRLPKRIPMLSPKGVCVVVGCGPGLGSSIAVKFAAEGYDVAVMSRKIESSSDALQKIKVMDRKAIYVSLDVCDEKNVKAAFAEVEEKLGDVDVLVFNASGPMAKGGILGMEIKTMVQRWNVECLGALLCARAVIPGMLRAKGGTLLFTSATSAFRGSAVLPGFAIAKFGLRALSQSIAKEYSSQGIHSCHIRIDCTLATPKNKTKYDVEKMGDCDEIAKTYFFVSQQNKMGWSNEIDIRPHTEKWTI